MAKAVLISIRPEWAEKILFGKKTLEVRKTRPCLETPFFVILFSLFCVLVATLLVWAILIIVKDVIELWRKIKE